MLNNDPALQITESMIFPEPVDAPEYSPLKAPSYLISLQHKWTLIDISQ